MRGERNGKKGQGRWGRDTPIEKGLKSIGDRKKRQIHFSISFVVVSSKLKRGIKKNSPGKSESIKGE